MSDCDTLDPNRLARESVYSAEQWLAALNAARGVIPEPDLIKLVESTGAPWLIANLLKVMEYPPLTSCGVNARGTADTKPATDPRERALWLKQRRNTGPR